MALVVQRASVAAGARLEAKAFMAWRGRWQPVFYERLEVTDVAGPGDGLAAALEAWRDAPSARPKRLSWTLTADDLTLSVRRPTGALRISATELRDAGVSTDPHGRVTWRVGPATLEVNGRRFDGHVVTERLLPPTAAWPSFGRFEMWVVSPEDGGLLLARAHLHEDVGDGEALLVTPGGAAGTTPFAVEILEARRDATTGFARPTRWRLSLAAAGPLVRAGGDLARGVTPRGDPAVYDIGLAVEADGGAEALVFHLQDR